MEKPLYSFLRSFPPLPSLLFGHSAEKRYRIIINMYEKFEKRVAERKKCTGNGKKGPFAKKKDRRKAVPLLKKGDLGH